MTSNGNNNTDFFGFTIPIDDPNNPPSTSQGFTNTNSNIDPNTAPGSVFFGPPPPSNHVFHNNNAATAPSVLGQGGQHFLNGNASASPSYFASPAIPQTATFQSTPGHGPIALGHFGHNFYSGNHYLTASYLETPTLPASTTFSSTPGPAQTHFGQTGQAVQNGNISTSPSYDYIESPELESPPSFPAPVFFGPPPPPPLPAFNAHPPHNLNQNPQPPSVGQFAHVNHWALPHLTIGDQNPPQQGHQHASNPANTFVGSFGGLNIQGAPKQPPEDESEDEDMEMDPSAEGLDFGNSDEDYSEDENFEYDYVDENDEPIRGHKLPDNAAMMAMMNNNAAQDAAMPDTEAGDLDHDEDFPDVEEIEYADDEEDSDWEDDPTGYH
ncbi:hypothetical protein V493_07368, partial [Pseudogymnoascus sp. VKM F-4281 (FW-2241)]